MRKVKYMKSQEIKEEWKLLEKYHSTPYQTYDFLYKVPLATSPKAFFKSYKGYEMNITLWENSECIMIIPLVVFSKRKKMCEVHLRGYDMGAGWLGILYSDICTYDDFAFCFSEGIKFLKSKFEHCVFLLGRIADNNLEVWLDNFLNETKHVKKLQKCVAINIKKDYETWYTNLNKKMRQNIRTMYNRISTDSVQLKIKIYKNEIVNTNEYNTIQKLYAQRILEKNKRLKSIPGLTNIIYFLKKHNGFVQALNNRNSSFHVLVKLNNVLVAFMSGVIDFTSGRVIIPHLSYNSNYKRYSPGILLVCEAIKYISNDNELCILDLSCGAEGYKYTLGGEEYSLCEFSFCV